MRARNDPETWAIEPALLDATLTQVAAWAAQEWPDMQAPQPYERRFVITEGTKYRFVITPMTIDHAAADAV